MQCNCSGIRFTLGPHVSKTKLGNWIITHIFSPIFIYVWPLFAHSDLLTSNTILTKACDPFHPRVCILLSTTVHLHNHKQANLMLLEYSPSIISSALSVVTHRPVASRASPRSNLGCIWSSLVLVLYQSELAGQKSWALVMPEAF